MTKPKAQHETLKLRKIAIDTYRENVAYLHRDCPIYRTEGFQALSKLEIKAYNNKQSYVLALLNVVDNTSIVATDELGLSEQAFDQLNLAEGQAVRVCQAEPPKSIEAVHRKIAGEQLSLGDFRAIMKDITGNRYSKMELAAFLVSCSHAGLERDEVLHLTRSMVESGDRLDWGEPLVADKHCIGGIPGNRTSMLVVPIVAAHGMLIPKTSSRAITSPSGTADTMEVLSKVKLSLDQLHTIVRRERGCLAWGGTALLAPADDILISVERPLSMDSPGQMVASILAKKVAAGSTHLLIDIPVGSSAKIRSMDNALRLRKLFEFVGDRLGLHVQVIITDGEQPVGRGIGPVLETRDVMQVLHNEPDAPHDLRQKALRLAGRILEFDPDVRGGDGFNIARDILDSGRALIKMQAIIHAQGKIETDFKPGKFKHDVTTSSVGTIVAIDNLQMAKIARLAGAPLDKGAGVDLYQKIGDTVQKGDVLYSIYADFPTDFQFAKGIVEQNNGYTIKT